MPLVLKLNTPKLVWLKNVLEFLLKQWYTWLTRLINLCLDIFQSANSQKYWNKAINSVQSNMKQMPHVTMLCGHIAYSSRLFSMKAVIPWLVFTFTIKFMPLFYLCHFSGIGARERCWDNFFGVSCKSPAMRNKSNNLQQQRVACGSRQHNQQLLNSDKKDNETRLWRQPCCLSTVGESCQLVLINWQCVFMSVKLRANRVR